MANKVKRYRNPSARLNKWAYLFIAPFIIAFLIFSLYPMISSIAISFTRDSKNIFGSTYTGVFTAWSNYDYVLHNNEYWHCYINTLLIFAMNFIPQLVAALFFAALFTSRRIRMLGKKAFQFIYFLPNILTATTVSLLFITLFQYGGTVSKGGPLFELLVKLGMSTDARPLQDTWSVRIIIAFIQFWMWFGNSMLVYISGIKSISNEIFEAADLDGASGTRVFFQITLPILKPIMVYSLITSIIGGLQMFDIPYFIQGETFKAGIFGIQSPTKTVTIYIYQLMVGDLTNGANDISVASAASVILFLFTLVLSLFMYLFVFREKNTEKKVWRKINAYKNL